MILGQLAVNLHQHVALDIDVGGEDTPELLVVFTYRIQGFAGRKREDATAGPLSRRGCREAHLLLVGLRDQAPVLGAFYGPHLADLQSLVAEGLYHLLGGRLPVHQAQQQHDGENPGEQRTHRDNHRPYDEQAPTAVAEYPCHRPLLPTSCANRSQITVRYERVATVYCTNYGVRRSTGPKTVYEDVDCAVARRHEAFLRREAKALILHPLQEYWGILAAEIGRAH